MSKVLVSKEEIERAGFTYFVEVPDFIELEGEVIEEECRHEPDNLAYTSNPPRYKCIKCEKFFSTLMPSKPHKIDIERAKALIRHRKRLEEPQKKIEKMSHEGRDYLTLTVALMEKVNELVDAYNKDHAN